MSDMPRYHPCLKPAGVPIRQLRPSCLDYPRQRPQPMVKYLELCTGLHHESCDNIVIGEGRRGTGQQGHALVHEGQPVIEVVMPQIIR